MTRNSLLSPLIAFPAAWLFAVALSQVPVLDIQDGWSTTTWAVVAVVPIAFVCGGIVGVELVRALPLRVEALPFGPASSSTRLRRLLVACIVIGFAEVVHQGIRGGVPLLAGDIDATRIEQPGGPTILLVELLGVAAVVGICVPAKLTVREGRFELCLAAVALAGLALQGGRGQVVWPIAVAFFARWLYWGHLNWRFVAISAAVVGVAISGVFFARTAQHPEQRFQAEFYNEVVPETPAVALPLIPIDLAVVTNFEALSGIVDYIPERAPYGEGAYNAAAIEPLVDAKHPGDIAREQTPPWVTSTVAGSLYADGGISWVVIGVALTGLISAGAYRFARRTREFRHALVAAYFLFLALFGLYTNYWTSYVNWLVVPPLLALVGAVAENPVRPPGLLHRVLAQARRRSAAGRAAVAPGFARVRAALPWRRLGPALIAAAAVLVVLALVGSALKEESPEGGHGVAETVTFAGGSGQGAGEATFATDGDLPTDNSPVWRLSPGGSELDLLNLNDERELALHAPLPISGGTVTYDVARWDESGEDALFRLAPSAGGVSVEAASVDPPGDALVTGTAPVPLPLAGATRELAIATWSGARPDLFVIDRGLEQERVAIRVFSGESGFGKEIVDARTSVREVDTEQWSIDVGDATEPEPGEPARPDLVMVRRDGSSEGLPEAHVLTGESDFKDFGIQVVLNLPEEEESRSEFSFGSSLGAPSIFAIEPTDSETTVRVIRLREPGSAL